MSNKQVPGVYRQIITQTLASARPDFEEQGVEEAVLTELQRLWEEKLAATGTADFASDARFAEAAKQAATAKAQQGGHAGTSAVKVKKETQDAPKPKVADSDELNSDLDDSDDEVDKEGGDLVIALYEKVNRVRNRWKIQLKDGVVNVKGKDYLFNKCAGEFEW